MINTDVSTVFSVLIPYLQDIETDKLVIPPSVSDAATASAKSNTAAYEGNGGAQIVNTAYFYVFLASYFIGMLGLYRHRVAVRHAVLAHFEIDADTVDFDSIDFLAGDVMTDALRLAGVIDYPIKK